MSRIGKQPILVPSGISVSIDKDNVVVSGAKGSLTQFRLDGIDIKQEGETIVVSRNSDESIYRARHGLMRSLINNMVIGIHTGFSKKLELNGVGYRVSQSTTGLKFSLGFSHEINYDVPQGITTTVEQNTIIVNGIDKQKVGQVAAEIRSLKKPEPYKGKGIKYDNERIIRKSGKSGKEK